MVKICCTRQWWETVYITLNPNRDEIMFVLTQVLKNISYLIMSDLYGLKRMNVTSNPGTEIMLGTSLVLNLWSSVRPFSFTSDIPRVSAVGTMAVLACFMYLVVFSL